MVSLRMFLAIMAALSLCLILRDDPSSPFPWVVLSLLFFVLSIRKKTFLARLAGFAGAVYFIVIYATSREVSPLQILAAFGLVSVLE